MLEKKNSQILSILARVVSDCIHSDNDDDHTQRYGHEQMNDVRSTVFQFHFFRHIVVIIA